MYFFGFFLVVSVVLAFLILFTIFYGSFVYSLFIFSLGGVDLSFSFVFDYVSLGFFSTVSFISRIVYFYSVFYMEGAVDCRRFC
jgi:NADH:ubiquinone oxidoreductase subunit 5 (subunit L)/multisubunit Na+/H+ antiporter MnhA subunit